MDRGLPGGPVALALGIITLAFAFIAGWVLNIAALLGGYATMEISELMLRLVGAVIAPLGAVLGWFL